MIKHRLRKLTKAYKKIRDVDSSVGYKYLPYLTVERRGKVFQALCPVCFSEELKWLSSSPVGVNSLKAKCVNGHITWDMDILIGDEIVKQR